MAAAAALIRCVIKLLLLLLLFDDWDRLAGTDVCVVPYKLLFNKLLLAFDVVFRLLFVNDCIAEFVIPEWDSDRLAACWWFGKRREKKKFVSFVGSFIISTKKKNVEMFDFMNEHIAKYTSCSCLW